MSSSKQLGHILHFDTSQAPNQRELSHFVPQLSDVLRTGCHVLWTIRIIKPEDPTPRLSNAPNIQSWNNEFKMVSSPRRNGLPYRAHFQVFKCALTTWTQILVTYLLVNKTLTRFSVVSRYCKRLKMNMLYLYTYAYIYIRIYFDIYDESCLFTFSIHKTLWYSKSQRKPLCLGWWIHKAKWQQIFDLSAERTDASAYVSTKHVYHHLSLKRILNNDVEGVCTYIYIYIQTEILCCMVVRPFVFSRYPVPKSGNDSRHVVLANYHSTGK